MWPFSQAEIEGTTGRIVELLLDESSQPAAAPGTSRADLVERIVRGGFPEAAARGAVLKTFPAIARGAERRGRQASVAVLSVLARFFEASGNAS